MRGKFFKQIDGINFYALAKNVKNFNFHYQEDGIHFSYPFYLNNKQILNVIQKNKKLLLENYPKSFLKKKEVKEIKKVLLFEQWHPVEFTDNKTGLKENTIYLPLKDKPNFKKQEQAVDSVIKEEFSLYLSSIFEHFSNLTGLKYSSFQIRKMKTRWGSCTMKTGRIRINFYLAMLNKELINSVVLHELAHLKYPNHKKDFYQFLITYIPNYKKLAKLLSYYRPPIQYIS